MKTRVYAREMADLFKAIHSAMSESKDRLTELDSVFGDADLGVTMERGFRAAVEEAGKPQEKPDVGALLVKVGLAFNRVSPSTLGTLLSGGFMHMGKALGGRDVLELADWVTAMEAMEQSIAQRGKAKVGDKTILDALSPFVARLKEAQAQGPGLADAWGEATAAARAGAEKARALPSKVGRSGWFREKTVGKDDPGAAAFVILAEAVLGFLQSTVS